MRIYFDVGANDGHDGIKAITSGNYDVCYAFEIDKRMTEHIERTVKRFGDRYKLYNIAVSSYNGIATYKSLRKNDIGTINELNIDVITSINRLKDFEVIDQYEVPVITLKQFCIENKITKIDHLHIDTEGSDFEVIKGLDDFIYNVEEGMMECFEHEQKNIYVNSTNKLQDCIDYLQFYGFKCSFRSAASGLNGNLTFKKK